MTPAAWAPSPQLWLGWAFTLGGAWFLVRQMRKDLNGIGAKANRLASQMDADKQAMTAEMNRKFTAIAILLLAAAGDEDKELLADRLLDKLAR